MPSTKTIVREPAGQPAGTWPAAGPFSLESTEDYRRWRQAKLALKPRRSEELVVEIADLSRPTEAERAAVVALCRRGNLALYRSGDLGRDPLRTRPALRAFGAAFGLTHAEDHRSAASDGIVAIEVADEGGRAGYIPYTDRPISWHTDGYYNYHGPSHCIQGMLLHCVRDAAEGGINAFLDPDIAYIRLRDADPAYIAALMHPQAMTIPANEEPDGATRAANVGPVFAVDPRSGALIMRYTARKRSIAWRDDATTRQAVQALERILDTDPFVVVHRLAPGEGIICNNVLHTRTAFADGRAGAGRLLYRVRYLDRIG